MIEQDTIKLLRECDAGVKMGVASIEDVLKYVKSDELRGRLNACKGEHEMLGREIDIYLAECGDDGKSPNHAKEPFITHKPHMSFLFIFLILQRHTQ